MSTTFHFVRSVSIQQMAQAVDGRLEQQPPVGGEPHWLLSWRGKELGRESLAVYLTVRPDGSVDVDQGYTPYFSGHWELREALVAAGLPKEDYTS